MSILPKAVATYLRQLPYGGAIGQLLLKSVNRTLDRWAVPSYGQTGEDRIIQSLLPASVRRFYVDVGCYHPRRYSNTFALYLDGWVGITIDANASHVTAHSKERPNDIQVCAALSSHDGAAVVFTEFAESAVSSLAEGHVEEWQSKFAVVGQHAMQTTTLTTVLREQSAPKRFGLLSIDAEGHDIEVLRGLNLREYRPALIVVEMHGYSLNEHGSHAVVEYLQAADYQLQAYAVMNGYFLDTRPDNG